VQKTSTVMTVSLGSVADLFVINVNEYELLAFSRYNAVQITQ
jgi:hypothetical protein